MNDREGGRERERGVVDRKGKRERDTERKSECEIELHILLGLSTLIL